MEEIHVIQHADGVLAYRLVDGCIDVTRLHVPEQSRGLGIATELIHKTSKHAETTIFTSTSLTGDGVRFIERILDRFPHYSYRLEGPQRGTISDTTLDV